MRISDWSSDVCSSDLPALGIKPRRIGYKCPWQNAVVERFHRTLQEELLDFIVPINVRHVNRLLGQYQQYYNTARPHMATRGYPPLLPGPPAPASAQPAARPVGQERAPPGISRGTPL